MFWITSEGRVVRVGGGGLVCMIDVVVGLMTTLGDVGEVLTCSRGPLCFRALFGVFLLLLLFISPVDGHGLRFWGGLKVCAIPVPSNHSTVLSGRPEPSDCFWLRVVMRKMFKDSPPKYSSTEGNAKNSS